MNVPVVMKYVSPLVCVSSYLNLSLTLDIFCDTTRDTLEPHHSRKQHIITYCTVNMSVFSPVMNQRPVIRPVSAGISSTPTIDESMSVFDISSKNMSLKVTEVPLISVLAWTHFKDGLQFFA